MLKPKERIKVTLRAFDKDYFKVINTAKQGGSDGVVQPFCATVSTTGSLCPVATNPVDVIVSATSANTGETTPRTDVIVTNPAGNLAIVTTTAAAATSSVKYAQQLSAAGGLSTNYFWSLAPNSQPLPPGLTLSTNGFISGIPTSAGTFPFTAQVTDGVQIDTQALTLIVSNGTVLSVATSSLPGGFTSLRYYEGLQANGGTGPYTWALATGTLPAGLTLDQYGFITGTPIQAAASTFTVQVTDAAQATASRQLTLTTIAMVPGDLIVSDGTVNTTNGKLYLQHTAINSAPQLIADIGGRPMSIAQDTDGSIVVADSTYDRVLRVTPGNVKTLYSGSPLSNPVAVAVLPNGGVVIGDNQTDTLYQLSIDGESVGIFTLMSLPTSPNELQSIQLAVDAAANKLIVADDAGLQLTLISIDLSGQTPPATILTTGTIRRAGGLIVNSQGNYLIADFSQQTIFTVTPAGAIQGSLAAATGTNVVGLGIGVDDNYYVAVNFANAVRKVTTSGVVSNVRVGAPYTYPTDLIVFRQPAGVLFALLQQELSLSGNGPQSAGIEIVDLETRTSLKTISLGAISVTSVAVSPDKQTLYVADWTNNQVLKVDVATGNPTPLAAANNPRDLVLSADGSTLYVAAGQSLLKINTSNGLTASFTGADTFLGITLSPDSSTIAAAATGPGTSPWLYLIDAQTLSAFRLGVTANLQGCSTFPNDVAFTNTGQVLMWDANCDALYQFQVSTQQQLGTIYLGRDSGTFFNFNNMLFYSAYSGQAYALKEDNFPPAGSNHLGVMYPPGLTFTLENGFSGLAFVPALSPDGKTLAASVIHRFVQGGGADTLDLLDLNFNTWQRSVFTFNSSTMSVRDMRILPR